MHALDAQVVTRKSNAQTSRDEIVKAVSRRRLSSAAGQRITAIRKEVKSSGGSVADKLELLKRLQRQSGAGVRPSGARPLPLRRVQSDPALSVVANAQDGGDSPLYDPLGVIGRARAATREEGGAC